MHRTLAFFAAASLALACAPASAVMCYRIIDRNDNLIYQDTFPPVDLSDAGTAQRDEMRKRGQHMIASDTERCPTLEFFTGSAGSPTLSIDQVVAGMNAPNMITAGPSGGRVPNAAPSRAPGTAPVSAPPKSSPSTSY